MTNGSQRASFAAHGMVEETSSGRCERPHAVRGGFDVSHRGTPPGWYARQGRVGRWQLWPVLWPGPEAVRNQALPARPTKQKRATLRRPRASVTSNRPLAATPARAARLMPCTATSAADAARQVFG